MDYKKETKKILDFLKQNGHTRDEIERKLGIATNGIDQALTRTGNERLYRQILLYKDWVLLQNASNGTQTVVSEPEPEYGDLVQRLIAQQNKLIDSMNRQSVTANNILDRLANNVENRVQSIDSNLEDALARIESLTINVTSGRSVILKSLARLEKKSELALQKEADNINASLLQELSGKQNKRAGRGK